MVEVIGAGVGRTGTYSLKLALEAFGYGPCHHMEEVLAAPERQIALWTAAAEGRPDWPETMKGYASAVDWPTAAFYRELAEAYPGAKFVLTTRSTESWLDSFTQTIHALMQKADEAPPEMAAWYKLAYALLDKSGFSMAMDRAALGEAYEAHSAAVEAAIPAERLLVFEVKQGWEPLCGFLGHEVPDQPFPRSNNREEFWDLAKPATD